MPGRNAASMNDDTIPARTAVLILLLAGAALAASLFFFPYYAAGKKDVPQQLAEQNIAELLRQANANPDDPQAYVELGWAYFTAGDTGRAEAAYAEALKLEPGHVPALANMGLLMTERRKYDEAERFYMQVLERSPGHELVRFNLGALAIKKGDLHQAAEHLNHALRANPVSGDAWYYLGIALEGLGEKAEALEAYRKALTFMPDDVQVRKAVRKLEEKVGGDTGR